MSTPTHGVWQTTALAGGRVRLEALGVRHAEELMAALDDPGVWAYIPWARPASAADMRAYIESALTAQATGAEIAVAMVDAATGKAFGTSRFTDILPKHRQLEVGWTMIGPSHQRTSANTEVKLMMLTHAFEKLVFPGGTGCLRVQLKCDHRNLRSQKAIERIGGVFEGRLRKHRVLPDGFVRDTMYYSVVQDEWNNVKRGLQSRLARE
jgi:N-acetyltransferase